MAKDSYSGYPRDGDTGKLKFDLSGTDQEIEKKLKYLEYKIYNG